MLISREIEKEKKRIIAYFLISPMRSSSHEALFTLYYSALSILYKANTISCFRVSKHSNKNHKNAMAQEENMHLFNISECKYKFTLAQPISGHSK